MRVRRITETTCRGLQPDSLADCSSAIVPFTTMGFIMTGILAVFTSHALSHGSVTCILITASMLTPLRFSVFAAHPPSGYPGSGESDRACFTLAVMSHAQVDACYRCL